MRVMILSLCYSTISKYGIVRVSSGGDDGG